MRQYSPILVFVFAFLLFEFGLKSCASRSSPSGGKKDTLAPALDTSFPLNQSIHFKANKIDLRFDEYLKLKNPQQQINIAPLLPQDLEIKTKGKGLEILLGDSLRPNTTYIISFGSSLADLNEGNTNKDFKYVFSTGDFIDSLSLDGELFDAYTAAPEKDFLVALYSADRKTERDSFLIKERPDYYAFTDEEGKFSMTNLRAGKFLLAAFEDKDGNFKQNSGREKMAFWTDTINIQPDSSYHYQLLSFEPEKTMRFYGARHKDYGLIAFGFSLPAEGFVAEVLDLEEDPGFYRWNASKDTLWYQFDYPGDSLRFKLNYDSLLVDSVISVRLKDYSNTEISIRTTQKEIRPWDTVFFSTNLPLDRWLADSTLFITPQDTTQLAPQQDSLNPRKWFYPPPHKISFTVAIKKGALTRGSKALKDSLGFAFNLKKGEDLGTLGFTVKADSSKRYLLQILDGQDEQYLLQAFQDSVVIELKNELPQKFKAYLIYDADSNGAFTTGDYALQRQPEWRVAYPEELEIRANWELDLSWLFEGKPEINKASLLTENKQAKGDKQRP